MVGKSKEIDDSDKKICANSYGLGQGIHGKIIARAGSSVVEPACRQAGAFLIRMYTVYVLRSLKDGTFYSGMTGNLGRRTNEHNAGWEKATRKHRPYEIIVTREFETRTEARDLEKKLKSGYIREKRRNLREFLNWVANYKGG